MARWIFVQALSHGSDEWGVRPISFRHTTVEAETEHDAYGVGGRSEWWAQWRRDVPGAVNVLNDYVVKLEEDR